MVRGIDGRLNIDWQKVSRRLDEDKTTVTPTPPAEQVDGQRNDKSPDSSGGKFTESHFPPPSSEVMEELRRANEEYEANNSSSPEDTDSPDPS